MAAEETIYLRTTSAEVHRIIAQLPAMASGRIPGPPGLVEQLQVRIGLAALGNIKNAFLIKSRGGTDETGERWPPLSPTTIAYSRRHPRVPSKRQRAAFRPSFALTPTQREQWWSTYRRYLGRYNGDKTHAARAAWAVLKASGVRTLLDMYGDTAVDILRDTGLLFNSLTPGCDPAVARPVPPQVEEQVFQVLPGEVIIGTSRKWAWTHHHGIPGKLPQRRLWPAPARWTPSWWETITEQASAGLEEIARFLLGRR